MKYLHHDCGPLAPVIHSDLKPQNVLLNLSRDGKPSQVKVADFGISATCEVSSTLYMTYTGRNRWGENTSSCLITGMVQDTQSEIKG
jgi:serine/threonine protein kinase